MSVFGRRGMSGGRYAVGIWVFTLCVVYIYPVFVGWCSIM